MFCWLFGWTVCLLGLTTTSTASPDDAPVDFGGESGSGMLQTGKSGVTPVEPLHGQQKHGALKDAHFHYRVCTMKSATY